MSSTQWNRRIMDCVLVMTASLLTTGCDRKEPSSSWIEGELYVQMVHHGVTLRGIALEMKYFLITRKIAYSLHFSTDCNFANMERLGQSENGFIVPLKGKDIPLHSGARYRAKGMVFDEEWAADGSLVRMPDGNPMPAIGPGFGLAKTLYVTDFELLSKAAPRRAEKGKRGRSGP